MKCPTPLRILDLMQGTTPQSGGFLRKITVVSVWSGVFRSLEDIRVDNPRKPPLIDETQEPPLVFGRILKTHKDLARILKNFRPPSAARKNCEFEGFYRGFSLKIQNFRRLRRRKISDIDDF